jgi:hypothetical protein
MVCSVICQRTVFVVAVDWSCCLLSSSSDLGMSLLLSRFLSTVTASSTLCFSYSGSIDNDLSDTNLMASSSTTVALVR